MHALAVAEFIYLSLYLCTDSLTESDESDDHKIEKNEGTLKRRKKSKSRQPKSSEPEMSIPSEEERDFVTIPDPQKVW